MKTHELKIQGDFADAVYSGEKTFEIRENDRGFQKGDHIKFKTTNDCRHNWINAHAIEDCEYEITYILNGWGLKENYVVLAIKPVKGTKY